MCGCELLVVCVNLRPCVVNTGYSGADMANLCRDAAYWPLRSLTDISDITIDQVLPQSPATHPVAPYGCMQPHDYVCLSVRTYRRCAQSLLRTLTNHYKMSSRVCRPVTWTCTLNGTTHMAAEQVGVAGVQGGSGSWQLGCG